MNKWKKKLSVTLSSECFSVMNRLKLYLSDKKITSSRIIELYSMLAHKHFTLAQLSSEYEAMDVQDGRFRDAGVPTTRSTIAYINWRKAVLKRDNYTCQMCDNVEELQAHHILSYSQFPEKRISLANGITLCKSCHEGGGRGK